MAAELITIESEGKLPPLDLGEVPNKDCQARLVLVQTIYNGSHKFYTTEGQRGPVILDLKVVAALCFVAAPFCWDKELLQPDMVSHVEGIIAQNKSLNEKEALEWLQSKGFRVSTKSPVEQICEMNESKWQRDPDGFYKIWRRYLDWPTPFHGFEKVYGQPLESFEDNAN